MLGSFGPKSSLVFVRKKIAQRLDRNFLKGLPAAGRVIKMLVIIILWNSGVGKRKEIEKQRQLIKTGYRIDRSTGMMKQLENLFVTALAGWNYLVCSCS